MVSVDFVGDWKRNGVALQNLARVPGRRGRVAGSTLGSLMGAGATRSALAVAISIALALIPFMNASASDAIPPAERYLQEREELGLPSDPAPKIERPLPQGGIPGDELWWDGFGPQELNNTVLSSTIFDSSLVVGGDFTQADGQPVLHVARWTGGGWAPIGEGLNGSVFALAVWQGRLVAGGRFTASGDVGVARVAVWQDSTWAPLGAGFDRDVLTLEAVDSVLYAGGHFTQSGQTATLRIAQWSGSEWIQPGAGFAGGTTPFVNDITEFDGSILAAGRFSLSGTNAVSNVARWDGSQWVAFGETNERVYALFEHEAQLFAGGNFTRASGQNASYVARWNGSQWGSLGSGMDGPVLTFASADSALFAGGLFHRAGGRVSDSVARLGEMDSWISTNSGMNGGVVTLASFEGDLIAGGVFSQAGGAQVSFISRFRDDRWSALSMMIDGAVTAMTLFQGRLIAGGTFQRADGVIANGVAAWDGTRWSALGGGFDGPVQALANFQGSLYAGGAFELSDSTAVSNLARWDGSNWQPLGTGANNPVWTFLSEPTRLLVGGDFTNIDGVTAARVAAFDGSAWSVIGPGLPGRVRTLSTFADTAIVAGGDFNAGNLHYVAHLAQNEWRPLGSGTNGPVLALQEYQGRLLAGGSFTEADSAAAPGIAVWDSLGWSAFAPSLSGTVNRLLVHGNSLYVGGDFQVPTVDLESARFLARLRDGVWSALGSGVDGVVLSLSVYDDDLYVGGSFSTAGGRFSPNIARWFDVDAVPVRLQYFEAHRDGPIVRLRWGVTSAIDHAGFRLYRGDTSPDEWLSEALIEPTDTGKHEFLDRGAPSGEIAYWLEEVSNSGHSTMFGPIYADRAGSTQSASFDRIWPSPFRNNTSIRFTLGQSESITLFVHDAAGRRVATLIDGPVGAGPHEIQWDGYQDGRRLPPGLYFVSLSGHGWNESGRVLLLR